MNYKYLQKAKGAIRMGSKTANPFLIILMGLPGCGKSYVSDYLYKKYSFTILSGENITYAIFKTEKCSGSQYREAYKILRLLAKDLLNRGYSVVIDSTNLKYEFRKQIYDLITPTTKMVLIYLVADDLATFTRANQRGVNYNNPKNIQSAISIETFSAFKSQLELPREDEPFKKVVSDENIFKSVNKIISELTINN